jgi:hypothetical protein
MRPDMATPQLAKTVDRATQGSAHARSSWMLDDVSSQHANLSSQPSQRPATFLLGELQKHLVVNSSQQPFWRPVHRSFLITDSSIPSGKGLLVRLRLSLTTPRLAFYIILRLIYLASRSALFPPLNHTSSHSFHLDRLDLFTTSSDISDVPFRTINFGSCPFSSAHVCVSVPLGQSCFWRSLDYDLSDSACQS